jgi:hypothetical protein
LYYHINQPPPCIKSYTTTSIDQKLNYTARRRLIDTGGGSERGGAKGRPEILGRRVTGDALAVVISSSGIGGACSHDVSPPASALPLTPPAASAIAQLRPPLDPPASHRILL